MKPESNKKALFVAGLATLFFLAVLVLAACGSKKTSPPPRSPGMPKPYQIDGIWYQPIPHARNFRQEGLASWYGKDFHGKKTANGEIYDMHAMTAAHKTLPLGTRVKVTNRKNGKVTHVRVNDRGPFVKGRIIDLSYSAAKELGVVGPGTAPVIVEAVAAPPSASAKDTEVFYRGNFTVQVGAFTNPDNARRLVRKLSQKYRNAHMVLAEINGQTFHRVRVGACQTLSQAREYESHLSQNGYPGAFVVAE